MQKAPCNVRRASRNGERRRRLSATDDAHRIPRDIARCTLRAARCVLHVACCIRGAPARHVSASHPSRRANERPAHADSPTVLQHFATRPAVLHHGTRCAPTMCSVAQRGRGTVQTCCENEHGMQQGGEGRGGKRMGEGMGRRGAGGEAEGEARGAEGSEGDALPKKLSSARFPSACDGNRRCDGVTFPASSRTDWHNVPRGCVQVREHTVHRQAIAWPIPLHYCTTTTIGTKRAAPDGSAATSVPASTSACL